MVQTLVSRPTSLGTPAAPARRPALSSPATSDRVELTSASGRDPNAPAQARWTILMYNAADNNLTQNQIKNVTDCQKVGSTSSMNVVSQFDFGGTQGCNRYYVKKSASDSIDSPVVQALGDTNMADPKVLGDFIQWGVKNYPADHYMLVINDHGDGWRGAVEDDGSGGAFMSLPDIQKGIQIGQDASGRKLDIVGFDACLMANAEVAEQLKNNCDYLVASEETEGTNGWPMTNVVSAATLKSLNKRLAMRADTSAKEFGAAVVKGASTVQGDLPTLSAFDMSQVPAMTAAEKGLADAIKASTSNLAPLSGIASNTQAFYDTSDLYDFADRLTQSSDVTDPAIQKAAAAVKDAISHTVYAEQHDTGKYPNAHGITVNLSPDSATDAAYTGLNMPQATGWDSMLPKLAPPPSPSSAV